MLKAIPVMSVLISLLLNNCSKEGPIKSVENDTNNQNNRTFSTLSFDHLSSDRSVFPLIGIDSNKVIHVVYYDDTILKYATYNGEFNIKEIVRPWYHNSYVATSDMALLLRNNVPTIIYFGSGHNVLSSTINNNVVQTDTLFRTDSQALSSPTGLAASFNNNGDLVLAYLRRASLSNYSYCFSINTCSNGIWNHDSLVIDAGGRFDGRWTIKDDFIYFVWDNGIIVQFLTYDGSGTSKCFIDSSKQSMALSLTLDQNNNPYFLSTTPSLSQISTLNLTWKENGAYKTAAIAEQYFFIDPVFAVYDNSYNVVYTKMVVDHVNELIYRSSINGFEKVVIKNDLPNENGGYPFVMKNGSPVICYYDRDGKTMKLIIED